MQAPPQLDTGSTTGTVVHHYVVYGRSSCPFCNKALSMLQRRGLAYTFYDTDACFYCKQRQKDEFAQLQLPPNATVPQIVAFTADDHWFLVGGCDALYKHLKERVRGVRLL